MICNGNKWFGGEICFGFERTIVFRIVYIVGECPVTFEVRGHHIFKRRKGEWWVIGFNERHIKSIGETVFLDHIF